MTEEAYWYWITNIPGVTPVMIRQMLEVYETPEQLYKDLKQDLPAGNIPQAICELMQRTQDESAIMRDLDKVRQAEMRFLYPSHPEYPARFRVLEDMPFSIYVRGKMPDPEQYAVSIVGARACTPYGKEYVKMFSETMAVNRVQVISGMAEGIDAFASKAALHAGGNTFVVLGTGADVIYPRENTELYFEILFQNGGILSEFPPGTKGLPWHFPYRNRLISALADKLVIIEARKRSGTLSTARHALAQGIDIYALPGRTTDPLSAGCNRLIADGCGILTDPKYFLEDLFAKPVRLSPGKGAGRMDQKKKKIYRAARLSGQEQQTKKIECLSETARLVYGKVTYEHKSSGQLVLETGLSAQMVTAALTELLLENLISETAKDIFCRI